jgi:hypothetical protein
VSGYGPIQQLADLDQRIFPKFEFNALMFTSIDDIYWGVKDLVDVTTHDLPMTYEPLRAFIRNEGLTPETSVAECVQKLNPHAEEILAWVYGGIVQRCRDRNISPFFVVVPHTGATDATVEARVDRSIEVAKTAGFTVIDCRKAYDGLDPAQRWITPWDSHPNTQCHHMLAQMLYDKINSAGL